MATSPIGSTALIEGIGETVTFTADVIGTYIVHVTLRDGRNTSTTEQVTITIVPS